MSENVIELTDLTKRYGSHTAVDGLNLTIRKGEIFGLLGPNGAGKSTTILMMLGLTEPTSGSVRVCGINSTKNPIEVKRKVGYLPEDVGFYEDYTGLENLLYTAQLNRLPDKDARQRAELLLKRVGLDGEANKKAGKYSRGMRQRLGLADVLIKSPEVIILDEPTLGIDPEGVLQLLELIKRLSREEGLTVLLSSHHLQQVQEICDRVGLFAKGRLLAEGDVRTLSQNAFANEPFVIEAGIVNGKAYPHDTNQLISKLRQLENVHSVNTVQGGFQIGCSADVSPQVARVIVESGAGLHYLHKKEYNLDDIYHHYFNASERHE